MYGFGRGGFDLIPPHLCITSVSKEVYKDSFAIPLLIECTNLVTFNVI